MKKFLSLVLVLVVALFAIVPGVNAIKNNNNGSITINNPVKGKEYRIYQILTLESYVDVNGNGSITNEGKSDPADGYVYKTTADWAEFVAKSGFFKTDANGTVELVTGKDAASLAKAALAYAESKGLDDKLVEGTTKKTAGDEAVVFENLNLGYYLVDSSVGALCGLGTTSEHIIINEKNSVPKVDKDIVYYDENGNVIQNVDANNTFVGKTVYYQTTIEVGLGAEDYVLYDKMDNGLTYTEDSLTVKIGDTTLGEKDYSVEFNKDGYTFIITFIRELNDSDVIVVSYEAVLNKNAVTSGTDAQNPVPNKNTATLKYGDENEVSSVVKTYTYKFDLIKTNNGKTILKDAEFELYDSKTGGNRIYVVEESEGIYYVTQTVNNVKIKAGVAEIRGLAEGTYYLEETRNPDGYNKLLERQGFTITNKDIVTDLAKGTENGADVYTTGGVQVINTKGNLLPETGGIGTTLFIVIGSGMVLSFGLLLVTKLRMSKEEN